MKILHISDSHGTFVDFWKIYNIQPESIDVVIHSGDILPNFSRGIRAIEEPRQTSWVEQNIGKFAEWFKNKPVLMVNGNHDFVNVARILNKAGLNVIDIFTNDPEGNPIAVDFMGFRVYGSPWVPRWTGEWNYELDHDKEGFAVAEIIDIKPDIVVSHTPIRGVLDRNERGERCGSFEWANQLRDAETNGYLPKAFLCGHIHPSNGVIGWKSMIVSNAATTANVLEIN